LSRRAGNASSIFVVKQNRTTTGIIISSKAAWTTTTAATTATTPIQKSFLSTTTIGTNFTGIMTGKRKHDDDDGNKTNTTTVPVVDDTTTTPATTTSSSVTITEGSTIMKFPSDDESAVFYNPVQVQNRDLSILMISLYAERRAIRRAVQTKKKELNKQKQTNKDITKEEIQNQLKIYEESLGDGRQLLDSNQNDNGDSDSDNNKNKDGITILDALAASGLRSIRYWKEIPGVKHVTINDLEAAAVERAKDNVRNNSLESMILNDNSKRDYGICINHGDATHEMYMSRKPQTSIFDPLKTTPLPTKQQQCPMWDVIDLDPYGSAAPFLDGAVQSVENGGLLCITCTDMAALGGSHPETAYGRYGSLPIQSAKYLQELALRILLYTISISAAKYGRTIKPILSVGMNFYVRVFVEVYNDKKGVSDLCLNMGNVYQSTQCSSFITIPHGQKGGKNGNGYQSTRINPSVCPETGAQFKIGGPLWLGPLHDQSVVSVALKRLASGGSSNTSAEISPNMNLIATRSRLEGLLTSVSEELDTPLYYTLPGLCLVLKCTSPPLKSFKAAIVNAGYKVSGYHKEPGAIKTDAPGHVVWDIMRAWVDKNPLKRKPAEDSATFKILAMERTITDVDFTVPKKSWTKKNEKKITRFPQNPEKHWGPKRAATGIVSSLKTPNDETLDPENLLKNRE
jgi:tRNA (guanine26-N2/guanine27-N2)-dimethyltransferase